MTNQDLFTIYNLVPTHLKSHDPSKKPTPTGKPYFSVAARFDGPWVTLVSTDHFQALVNGLEMVQTLLEGTGAKLLVERLERDKDDSWEYNSIVLLATSC